MVILSIICELTKVSSWQLLLLWQLNDFTRRSLDVLTCVLSLFVLAELQILETENG